ncbi:MAG: hypothetical protein MJ252_28730 [archaeon]|nr:hypothetical protein [archaeon]
MEDTKNNRTTSTEGRGYQPIVKHYIPRMEAHEYEKKIQDLLEKIDILESRLSLVTEQRVKVVNKLKNFEEENDMLRDQISKSAETQKQFTVDKGKYEKKIQDLETSNKAMKDKLKEKFEILNRELEEKDNEMDRLNQKIRAKEETIKNYSANSDMTQRYTNAYKEDLEQQKVLNKKQSEKISALERQIDSLYVQKNSEGSLLLEIQHLKDDNLRLLQMLKSTEEFKDFAYLSETVAGGIRYCKPSTERKAKTQTAANAKTAKGIPNSQKDILDNQNWIPSDCYSFAMEFKNKYNLDLSENLLTDLLTSLNKIWQEREKRQMNTLKSKYQGEIMSLRRKLAMKSGYNEFTAKKTISTLRKDLKQTRDDLRDNIVISNKMRTNPGGIDLVENALKAANSFNNTKKCLENEIQGLKNQLAMKDEKYSGTHQFYNQGCFWMAGKSFEEVESFDKSIQDLYAQFEERVKNANLIAGQNELVDYNVRIINNSVKWFFNSVKDMVASLREKFSNWKFDTQKNLDILKANAKKKFN